MYKKITCPGFSYFLNKNSLINVVRSYKQVYNTMSYDKNMRVTENQFGFSKMI